jgi:uncharacterized repeat protein (TIGR03987 family)
MILLSWAVRFIVAALIFYTIGVWSERLAGRLKAWHLVFFWLGLATDMAGTTLMGKIAGGINLNFHGITGLVAITLMLVHTLWATVVLLRQVERAIVSFHKFSVFVWTVWLVPFVSGVILGFWR